jgi:CrcB protein
VSPELAVAVGGAVGAPARYLLDRAVPRLWGTAVVNLLGSLLAGVVAGAAPPGQLFFAAGVLGAFTTASTLAWEVLVDDRPGRLLAVHLVPGLLLAAGGFALGRAV